MATVLIYKFTELDYASLDGVRGQQDPALHAVTATVIDIEAEWVDVLVGEGSEGVIHLSELLDKQGESSYRIGDKVDVVPHFVENERGVRQVSRERAKAHAAWQRLEEAFANDRPVRGVVMGKVKGGFSVDVMSLRAFMPGSLADTRPIRDITQLIGEEFEFKVVGLHKKRNSWVVSRRAMLESDNAARVQLDDLQEGQAVQGVIESLADYGAFVDLGGVVGLVHNTNMAWKRIKHPREIVEAGQQVEVMILGVDRERNRIALGLKQVVEDPWAGIAERYPIGCRVRARITCVVDYGCFAELEEGVEGLVHVTEMDGADPGIHPSKIVRPGDEVEVRVLDIDQPRRRISLSFRQCL